MIIIYCRIITINFVVSSAAQEMENPIRDVTVNCASKYVPGAAALEYICHDISLYEVIQYGLV